MFTHGGHWGPAKMAGTIATPMILIMTGFLFQWPTLVTLAMFPILVTMYVLLARQEERDAIAGFGDEYRRYAARVPAFIPRLPSSRPEKGIT
jgi:protein-S-isoprenylcysteine O-methyltransferase Ste14